MAVQLILKNSSVQDKEATALQLANGEIALNYHQSGPFLQCKDSNGDVWRIGGVIIGANAPSSPSKGAWWFNASTDVLKFYDGSAWNEIFVNSIVDGDIDANAEIAVSKLADGTARQLLQTDAAGTGVEWTDNVDVPGTLDVTGVATFDNNVVITGNLTVNGTTTTIDTTTLIVEDKNIEMGSVDSPTDVTADGGGLTLKGATDKTFNWVNSTDSWTSSENVDLASGKTYKVNGTDVLSGSSLGSGVTGSSLTSVGTITSGTWNGTTVATGSGGTGQTTYTNGQLLIGKTDGTLNKATLTAGTNIVITNSDGGIEIATSGAGINNVVEDTTPQLGGDLDVQTHAINTSTVDGDIDLDANGAGLIQVTEFNLGQVPIVTQHDIGTAANEVPLNGMLGGMAFQDPASVSVDGGNFGGLTVDSAAADDSVTLDNSGRLLVGTSSVGAGDSQYAKLQVVGNSLNTEGFFRIARNTATGDMAANDVLARMFFTDSSGGRYGQIDCFCDGTPGTSDYPGRLVFSTTADGANSPTERVRLLSSGFFQCNGNTGVYSAFTGYSFRGNIDDTMLYFENTASSLTNVRGGIHFQYTGATPNSTSARFIQFDDSTAKRFGVRSNGGIENFSGNNVNLCDEREKKNIETLDSTWGCLKNWDLKKFHYNEDADTDDKRYGVIAQQVAEHCPEVITDWVKQEAKDAVLDEDGNVVTPAVEEIVRMGVKEQQMMWMAIKALQEAQTRIETLETANASLEARLTALEGGSN